MRSLQALMAQDECWYLGCMLPGAPVVGAYPDGARVALRLCGLHLEVIRLAMPRHDVTVGLWRDATGVPVLELRRLAA